jgi:hypothetical protein
VYPGFHRGDLDDVANDEQQHTKGQTLATTPPVRRVRTRESAQQRANAHEGDENGGPGCGDRVAACRSRVGFAEASQEILEDKNTTDLTLLLGRQRVQCRYESSKCTVS